MRLAIACAVLIGCGDDGVKHLADAPPPVDECATGTATCDPIAACTDEPIGYTCTCPAGYTGEGHACIEIDECKDDPCGANATCTNSPGSYACACNSGYEGDPIAGCTNTNECANTQLCTHAQCMDLEGSYNCRCDPGYMGGGLVGCTDIDECATHTCGTNAHCDNIPGNFHCTCDAGYEGDPDTACTDIDECLANPCDPNATCANTTPGNYSCTCNAPYLGNGTTCRTATSCQELHTQRPTLPSGTYSIGNPAFDAICDMTTANGGWTKITLPVEAALTSGAREYLYLYNGRYYTSPCTTLVWTWANNSGQELAGTYGTFDGTTAGTVACTGSAEKPQWGVGCSSGAGGTPKVLPIYSESPSTGDCNVCQDVPNAYGTGACATAGIYLREGCVP